MGLALAKFSSLFVLFFGFSWKETFYVMEKGRKQMKKRTQTYVNPTSSRGERGAFIRWIADKERVKDRWNDFFFLVPAT